MPDTWTMMECAECRSLYLDPRPDADSLPAAYSDYYTHHGAREPLDARAPALQFVVNGYLNQRFGTHRRPASSLGALLLRAIEPLRLKLEYFGRNLPRARAGRLRLLDIGCGNGAFMDRAREMGWQVRGCEPDEKAVAACRELGLDVVHGDAFNAALDGQRFDVITMSHVLEHVDDPLALLRRARELLASGGRLWIAIPNTSAIGLGAFGSAWINLHFPFHLCIPSRSALVHLLADAGFTRTRSHRRGMHARFHWRESGRVAREQHMRVPGAFRLRCLAVIGDIVATFSSRHAEELVVEADVA